MMKVVCIDNNSQRTEAIRQRSSAMTDIMLQHAALPLSEEAINAIKSSDIIIIDDHIDIHKELAVLNKLIKNHQIIISKNNEVMNAIINARQIFIDGKYNDNELVDIYVCEIMKEYYRFLLNIGGEDKKSDIKKALKAAKTNASVLISGETGTGKEILARFIHYHSTACHGPFISVNCAALPDTMIEAILFGYEKGAFTNAIQSYVGKFEQANNGTILLDEISEMPIHLQSKLLRVIQEREIDKIGGKKCIPVNVRIIATTNLNLLDQVERKLFRSDLYYRLNVVSLNNKSLRTRKLDIIPLAEFFVKKHTINDSESVIRLSDDAKQYLLHYSWPGNIRELDNVIQRAILNDEDSIIDIDDLSIDDQSSQSINSIRQIESTLEMQEAETIVNALKETNGVRQYAAELLKISPRTLRYKISKLKSIGIDIP